jgi:hypothetical protein
MSTKIVLEVQRLVSPGDAAAIAEAKKLATEAATKPQTASSQQALCSGPRHEDEPRQEALVVD